MALVSLLVMMAIGVIAMPLLAFGAEVDRGRELAIDEGETLREDAYLMGGSVDFKGNSQRDVAIVAGEADIPGSIDGSLNLAAGKATVSGRVGGSLRIAGGTVEITGDIVGDVIIAGGRVTMPSRARVGGDVILAGGQVDIRGTINGDITGYSGRLVLAGATNGAVDVNVGRLEVRSTARIDGNLTYRSSDKGDVASGADIGGTVSRPSSNPWDALLERSGYLGPILRALWSLLAGAAVILIAPRIARALGAHARRPLAAAGIGIVAVWLIPIVAVVLLVTVIGLPVGILMLAGFLIALYLSQIAAGMAIGRFILPNSWHDGSRGYYLLTMTLGVLIIVGLKMIPVPWVAGIIGAIVTIWGFGAVIMLLGNVFSVQQRNVE